MMFGVAISTHGRPSVRRQCLAEWARYTPDLLVVTNDVRGDGVAVTKNRGIAALMDAGCEHLLLCDDDIWPLGEKAWRLFAEDPLPHLMLCWGRRRLVRHTPRYSHWSHPRGVALYVHRDVVTKVGGMNTSLGRFGHEHVEWSRRIHNAGFTPEPFVSIRGHVEMWNCEDMGKPGETSADLAHRRRALTTVQKSDRDYGLAEKVMAELEGSTAFVPYRHAES